MSYHTNNRTQSYQPPEQRSAPAPSPHEVQPSPHEVQPSPHRRVVDEPELTPSPLVSAPPQDAELIETGPFSLQGYYPLYSTMQGAMEASSLGSYHTHVLNGNTYYMPDGLEMGVSQFHGDFTVEKVLADMLKPSEKTETYRGEWRKLKKGSNRFEVYEKGDIVTKDGVAYIAEKRVDGNTNPEVNSYVTYEPLRRWSLYAGRATKIDGGFF